MNRPFTYLGWQYKRPAACLAASVLLLQITASPASAQLLALNTIRQNQAAPAAESVLLKSLLKQWEQEYHATIFYESKLVDNKRVPAQPTGGTLASRLAAVLPQVNLQYKELRDNYFVVTSRAETTTAPAAAATANVPLNIPISGRVTQADGSGLPGVTVLVKGTTIGTATNADGTFSLSVPEGSVLVFSSVGYARQEVPVGTTTTFNLQLQEDNQALKEVVVVGYGTQTREDLSTSVASVNGAALARQPVAGFDQALQGQVAGVQVEAPTGAPGAAISVRVRGLATLNLNASPLYVIDGVPVLPDPSSSQELSVGNQRLNPLNTLNPNDIESIDVLKDGAAAAIYGVRAANGVVVITTKHGKVGQAQVGLTAYYGRQYLRKKLDVLNSSQFAQEYNDILAGGGLPPYFATTTNPLNADPLNPGPYNTDWQDAIYRPASLMNYQLNVSGGTDKTRYYVAGGYFKQDGISLNSGFDRYNFKINLEQNVAQRFRVGVNLNLSRTHTNGSTRSELAIGNSGTVLGALSQIPTIPIYNADGSYSVNPLLKLDNPIGNLLETSTQAIVYQAIGNVYAELDVLKNLKARSSLGIDFRTQSENQFISRNYPGTSSSTDPSTLGTASTASNQQVIWLNENTLTWNPNLGEKHHLTLLAGESQQASSRFTSGATTRGFASNIVPYLSAGSTAVGLGYSYADEWSLLSFFSRANYDYDGRYLLQVSARADGSSRFADGNKFGYFPAVSAGWNIARESFFPQASKVSALKLRASFGANGNQEVYTYSRYSQYSPGSNYQSGSTTAILPGITQSVIGNNSLRWETTYQYNAGLDIGMFNNRLTFNFDIYNKHTKDLLVYVPIPTSAGVDNTTVIQNIGSIENKGIEIGLNTINVEAKNGGFGWSTNFNVSGNRNKVLDLGQQVASDGTSAPRVINNGASITQVGSPLGSFYGYTVRGIVQTDAEGATLASPTSRKPRAGDISFVDVNADGVINEKDRTIIGNPNPKAFAGVTNTFTFKGLELSVFFQGSFGNDVYNQTRSIIEAQTGPYNQSTRVLNHWTPTNTNTDIPRAVLGDPAGNNSFSTRWIEDGSYVRLKNLTVAYNFPTSLSKRAAIQNLRLYVTAQNLVTWTHYLGYDPEVNANPLSTTSFGVDYGVYPQPRTFTAGVNATF